MKATAPWRPQLGAEGLRVSGHSPASSSPLRLGRDQRLRGIWPISPQAREHPRWAGLNSRVRRNSNLGNLGWDKQTLRLSSFFG